VKELEKSGPEEAKEKSDPDKDEEKEMVWVASTL
jgi:hypothetical protein